MMTSPSIAWWVRREAAWAQPSALGLRTCISVTEKSSASAASITASVVSASPVRSKRWAISPIVPKKPLRRARAARLGE
jgi:hypothetical protein